MAKINQKEYKFLKNYNHIGVKWISRNENGNLVISKVKPEKIRGKWLPNCPDEDWSELRNSHNNLLHFIQSEDNEPYSIAELIKEYEFGKILLAMAKEEIVLELECESKEIEK